MEIALKGEIADHVCSRFNFEKLEGSLKYRSSLCAQRKSHHFGTPLYGDSY